ncbi:MAG TPA: CDP-alcohol phosphatidyltransferase family protein [Propionibacteriaceae bacterium]|nr:CDP-alcohol phosphatidyltransferase family protein [Propionibacteriaceae bacterium]
MTLLLPRSEVVDVAGRIDRLRDPNAPDSNGPQDTRTPTHVAPPFRLRWSHAEYARKDAAAVDGEPAATSAKRGTFTLDDVRATYKKRDAWWTVFLVDPLVARMIIPLANRTKITPNQVSFTSFVVGLLAAAAFWQGDHPALVVGALLYHISFVLDCVDGKIARLKGTGSVFGMWLDYSFDRYRVLACTGALMYGQYQRSGEIYFIWLAVLVTFLDMLRYMDALQVYKLRQEMGRRLRGAARPKSRTVLHHVPAHGAVRFLPVGGAHDLGYYPVPTASSREAVVYARRRATRRKPPALTYVLQQEFWSRFGWWARVREVTMRRRVRPHLFSGVEYQMCIFIVGPLLDAVLGAVLVSAVLLLVFEVALIYKLLLSSRDFQREMRRLSGPGDDGRAVTAAATAVGAPEVHEEPEFDAAPAEPSGTGRPRYSGTQELQPAH